MSGEPCAKWVELPSDRQRDWAWNAMHSLAHSRTLFSLATYIELASRGPRPVNEPEALGIIQAALDREWISRHAGNYLGKLTKRR